MATSVPGKKKESAGAAFNLSERPLEALFYHAHKSNLSGEICLEKDGQKRRIFCREGKIIWASSTLMNESFARFLDEKQTDLSPEKIQNLKMLEKSDPERFLLNRDFPLAECKDLVQAYAERRCRDFFSWQEGMATLSALPMPMQKIDLKPIGPVQVIFQGIKEHYSADLLAGKFVKIQDRKLVITPDFKALFPLLHFSPAEQEVLKRIDGQNSIGQLLQTPNVDSLSIFRLIWVLFSLRMVGMAQTEETKRLLKEAEEKRLEEERKAKEKLLKKPEGKEEKLDPKQLREEILRTFETYEKQTYFEILGIDRKASTSQVRKAFVNLAKKFHPDALTQLGMHDLVDKTNSIFAKMSQANEILSDEEQRKEYEASLDVNPELVAKMNDIINAEMEFQKGEILLRNRSYPQALAQFQKAFDLNPEEAEHYVYLGWAQFLTTKDDKKTAATQAKTMINKGLAMRGNIDMAFIFLGRLAKAMDQTDEAEKHFNKALQINPNNDQAESELRVLSRGKK